MRTRATSLLATFLILGAATAFAADTPPVATTAAATEQGEKVLLFPNGRWEFADPKKAEVQKKAADIEKARERSAQGGGLIGLGRTLHEGDRDYNRGSLNPKLR
jgi:hypothetical protein